MTAQPPATWATQLTALAECRAARPCPYCRQPRKIVHDNTTLPVHGLRLAACHCTEDRNA